jgi:uncharacterized protein DUF2017
MGRRRSGFARTVKGLEIWLDPEVAAVIRRSVREVQELIASEPAVDGLAVLGAGNEAPQGDDPFDDGLGDGLDDRFDGGLGDGSGDGSGDGFGDGFGAARPGDEARDHEAAAEAEGTNSELQGMLDAGTLSGLAGLGGEVPPLSDDPALARLFPAAYNDADQAEEYRRYTYTELHAAKVAGLDQLARQLTDLPPHVVLDDASAQVWLSALNDVRLVIGSRIGLTEDNADELDALPPGDLRSYLYGVYVVLTSLQDSLVEALAGW